MDRWLCTDDFATINHQILKSLSNLTTFLLSNYFKNNMRYKLSISLSTPYYSYIAGILYKKLNIGNKSQNYKGFFYFYL